MLPPAGIGQVEASGEFHWQRDALRIEPLRVSLPELELSISGAVQRDAAGVLTGQAAARHLTLARLRERLPLLLPSEAGTPGTDEPPVRADVRFRYDPSSDELELHHAGIAGPDLAAALIGRGGLSGSPAWQGTLTVPTFNLQRLLARLGRRNAAAPQRVSLTGNLRRDRNGITLQNLDARLGESQLRGQLLRRVEPLRYRFDLDADQLDVTPYFEAWKTAAIGTNTATAPFSGTLSIDRFAWHGTQVAPLTLGIEQTGTLLRLEPLRGRVFGGIFGAELSLNRADGRLGFSGSARNIAFGDLLAATTGNAAVRATAALNLELQGVTTNARTLLGGANGRFDLNLRDGHIIGVDLGRRLCELYVQGQGLPQPPATAALNTAFTSFASSGRIENGVAQTDELRGRSNGLTMRGAGRSDLAEGTMAFEVVLALTAPVADAQCAPLNEHIGRGIPVSISGTWHQPELRPDFTRLRR